MIVLSKRSINGKFIPPFASEETPRKECKNS